MARALTKSEGDMKRKLMFYWLEVQRGSLVHLSGIYLLGQLTALVQIREALDDVKWLSRS